MFPRVGVETMSAFVYRRLIYWISNSPECGEKLIWLRTNFRHTPSSCQSFYAEARIKLRQPDDESSGKAFPSLCHDKCHRSVVILFLSPEKTLFAKEKFLLAARARIIRFILTLISSHTFAVRIAWRRKSLFLLIEDQRGEELKCHCSVFIFDSGGVGRLWVTWQLKDLFCNATTNVKTSTALAASRKL